MSEPTNYGRGAVVALKGAIPPRTVFTTDSPERAWEPFMNWLEKYGVDPALCSRLEVHPDGTGTATLFQLDDQGKKIINPDRESLATYEFEFPFDEPPPRRS